MRKEAIICATSKREKEWMNEGKDKKRHMVNGKKDQTEGKRAKFQMIVSGLRVYTTPIISAFTSDAKGEHREHIWLASDTCEQTRTRDKKIENRIATW